MMCKLRYCNISFNISSNVHSSSSVSPKKSEPDTPIPDSGSVSVSLTLLDLSKYTLPISKKPIAAM